MINNDELLMQKKSDEICNVLGIPRCTVKLLKNKVSRYSRHEQTIKLRNHERVGMLPVSDAFLHELSHHIQYELSYELSIRTTSHDNLHYTCLLSVLDFFEHKGYAWNREYASYKKKYVRENNPKKGGGN